MQGYTKPLCLITVVTYLCIEVPNICGFSVWKPASWHLSGPSNFDLASNFFKYLCKPLLMNLKCLYLPGLLSTL